MITLTLPVPPSLNNLYPTVVKKEKSPTGLASIGRVSREDYLAAVSGAKPKTRRIKSRDYEDWIRRADAMLMMQKPKFRGRTIEGKWGVGILMPPETADLDNRIKPILDFLVRLGLTPDDRHARRILIEEMQMGGYVADEYKIGRAHV